MGEKSLNIITFKNHIFFKFDEMENIKERLVIHRLQMQDVNDESFEYSEDGILFHNKQEYIGYTGSKSTKDIT